MMTCLSRIRVISLGEGINYIVISFDFYIVSKQSRYECKYYDCEKVFADKGSLRKHEMTHGEKQYICPYSTCGKKFLDNSKLRRHLLVHTVREVFTFRERSLLDVSYVGRGSRLILI